MEVVAHKTLRSTQMGLGGKSYRIDKHGVLRPQPEGGDRRAALLIRSFYLRDDPEAPKPSPLTPPAPAPDAPIPVSAAVAPAGDVEALTKLMDAVDGDGDHPVDGTLARSELEDEGSFLAALPIRDLHDLARERKIPNYKLLRKEQLVELLADNTE